MTMTLERPTVDTELLIMLFGDRATVGYTNTDPNLSAKFEVNNLELKCEPLLGDIIATGEARMARGGERRTHYLVRIAGQLASFRICSADPESGYHAFATGQLLDDTPENEAKVLRNIEALCDC